jgi:Ase1/PRC1/MAP65 family protein
MMRARHTDADISSSYQLFAALSETLHNQVKQVTSEKKKMVEEANGIITIIRQMEVSLEDSRARRSQRSDDELKITYPLTRCLAGLKEKQVQIARLHRERWEQVKSMSLSCSPPPMSQD